MSENSNVKQLATSTGLTPEMGRVTEALWKELWDAIDKAADSGMGCGMMVGTLEFIKAALIKSHFGNGDD